nr:helitron helicase-like domain-containing protein [Tanacetum cinerariifolium]
MMTHRLAQRFWDYVQDIKINEGKVSHKALGSQHRLANLNYPRREFLSPMKVSLIMLLIKVGRLRVFGLKCLQPMKLLLLMAVNKNAWFSLFLNCLASNRRRSSSRVHVACEDSTYNAIEQSRAPQNVQSQVCFGTVWHPAAVSRQKCEEAHGAGSSQSEASEARKLFQSNTYSHVPRRRGGRNLQPSDTSAVGPSSSQNHSNGPSYIDLGNCDQRCYHCGYLFWYGERLKGQPYARRTEYHLCCGGGAIFMEHTQATPVAFQELLKNKHFMENIRAYNQMFAMTSFGVKINESVNRWKGPYVFEVSGQIYHWIDSLCPEEGHWPCFLQLYIYDTSNEVSNYKCRDAFVPDFKMRFYNMEVVRGYELPTSQGLGGIIFESGPRRDTDYDVIIEAIAWTMYTLIRTTFKVIISRVYTMPSEEDISLE